MCSLIADGHVLHIFACLGHVQDDTGETRSRPGAQHLKSSRSSRGHEPLQFHQEGVGASRGTADYAGVVGEHATSEANPGQAQCRASSPRDARFTMIVLDASVVVELLTNGGLAESIKRDLA